jgi:hypothetical protein
LIYTTYNKVCKKYKFKQQGFISDNKDIRMHPTQKPTELLKIILNDYAPTAITIFDPFMGSGSGKKLPAEKTDDSKHKRPPRSTCIKRNDKAIYRRAFSETQLLDILPLNMKDGESYHCITGGDVDSLSYLKIILRQQDLDYCLFSTWCMASEDIHQFEDWLDSGKIKKLDAYVGEIFPGTYHEEYHLLKSIVEGHGGRVAVFRNHSKIFAGYGDKFYFGIEGSANINTNPRTENGCITIGKEIFDFYFNYFNGINSFE